MLDGEGRACGHDEARGAKHGCELAERVLMRAAAVGGDGHCSRTVARPLGEGLHRKGHAAEVDGYAQKDEVAFAEGAGLLAFPAVGEVELLDGKGGACKALGDHAHKAAGAARRGETGDDDAVGGHGSDSSA